MLEANCLCGAVRLALETQPEFINDCNCSLCRKTGGAWGYYLSSAVTITGKTVHLTREDMEKPAVEIHSCAHCFTTTHWTLTQSFKEQNGGPERVGVNMRLFETQDLYGVEVRFPDGENWPGEGEYGYRRPAFVIGKVLPL